MIWVDCASENGTTPIIRLLLAIVIVKEFVGPIGCDWQRFPSSGQRESSSGFIFIPFENARLLIEV